MKNYIVGLGEILWDVLPEGKKLGGAPANFAYHASQFGMNGLAVSAIGRDSLGDEILNQLSGKNLHHQLEKVEFPTGTVQVTLDKNGIPNYDICQGVAYDNIPWTPDMEAIAKETQAVCFGTLAQRDAVSRGTILQFLDTMPVDSVKIYDINLRQHWYTKEIIEDSLQRSTILKINDEELVVVREMMGQQALDTVEFCRYLLDTYALKLVILTCGVEGSYVVTANECLFQGTPKVEVADTVGAGDSFTSAFCVAYLKQLPLAQAHKLAVDVSAYVCTQSGAMPELPAELKAQID
ncbi:MAG: carbohydrate kinase [Bacteroidales bacterium]|nr:carbohydrate kinase [Bacteroidales bacterium]